MRFMYAAEAVDTGMYWPHKSHAPDPLMPLPRVHQTLSRHSPPSGVSGMSGCGARGGYGKQAFVS